MAQRTIVVRPQLQGILAKEAFQRSPQASAFDSFNFWPIDPKTGRAVPGTRPPFRQLTAPEGTVTLLEGVNGKSTLGPFNSFAAGVGGDLYYWNGSGFTAATGAQADEIDTDRFVSAAPFINQLVITKAGAKPILFDYPTGTAVTIVETEGTAPSDARIAVNWQGAVWLAGREADPHVIYASRVGVVTDWDFGVDPEDQFGAFFSDTETAGKLSGPVTALMPQTSDTMIVSTFEGLLAMRGHPRQGGVIEVVGKGRYALGQGAWCKIPGDILLFLTPLGIMALDPSPSATPTLFSKMKMPEELIGLPYSYMNPTATMVYDNRWNQVHIFNRGTFEQGWTFDIESGSFNRIDAASYPFCTTPFPAFDSEQSSGTLFGRYDGIWFFDKFSDDETFAAGFTLNPVLLTPDAMSKGIIDRIRVILGRDSPSSGLNGSLQMALGIDAQDAVSKALAGSFDYSVDLQTLKENNGVCYPKQSGQAVVFSLTHAGGEIAIEEIHMDVSDAGYNRGFRSTQFAADGEETNFSESISAFDPTLWVGYQEGTPQVSPGVNLPDFTHFLDLSIMDSTWWETVTSNGRDIRVTRNNNIEVPHDLIRFDYTNQEGLLAFKLTQATTAVPLRVWVGNPNVVPYDADATNGQYATYDDDWRVFIADGFLLDRTQYGNDLAVTSGVIGSSVAGPIGGLAREQGTAFRRYLDFIEDNELETNITWTIVSASRRPVSTANTTLAMLTVANSLSVNADKLALVSTVTSGSLIAGAASDVSDSGTDNFVSTGPTTSPLAQYHHFAAVFTSRSSRTGYTNGTAGTTNVQTGNAQTLVELSSVAIGLDGPYPGDVSLQQVHTVARPAAWVAYQAAMMDQSAFWGTFAPFTQVNTPLVVTFNPVACPSGVITPIEVGTWSGYAAATPDAPSSSILNVLHLIDLSAMPASWWSAVANDGHDIRATDGNNVFLPLDLIDFNSSLDTGFAVVRSNQFTSAITQIRLWVGNATAINLPDCALYGRYGVYDEEVRAFWPGGSGEDRTQWLNDTATMTPDTVGPVGNLATSFDGTQSGLADDNIPATVPLTLIAAAKVASSSLFEDATLVSLTSEINQAAAVLKTKASANPARLVMRKPTGGEITSGNLATVTPGNWWLQSGVAVGSTQRRVLVNGAGTPESTVEAGTVAGLSRATVGGQTLPDDSVFNQFTGTLSLVGVHSVVRPDPWVLYQFAMFNQATFWNTWAWTASSSSLPQP